MPGADPRLHRDGCLHLAAPPALVQSACRGLPRGSSGLFGSKPLNPRRRNEQSTRRGSGEVTRGTGIRGSDASDQQTRVPQYVIVPANEPVVNSVFKSTDRWTTKLPVAPANRPVPPVMLAVSTIENTPASAVGVPRP